LPSVYFTSKKLAGKLILPNNQKFNFMVDVMKPRSVQAGTSIEYYHRTKYNRNLLDT
jgi:hypothetical protein